MASKVYSYDIIETDEQKRQSWRGPYRGTLKQARIHAISVEQRNQLPVAIAITGRDWEWYGSSR